MVMAAIVTSTMPAIVFYPLIMLTTILLLLYLYLETSRLHKYGKKLPGPPTVPFFGNGLLTTGVSTKDMLNKLLEHDIYGNVVRAFVGTKLIVFLLDPCDIEIILSSNVHIDKSPEYRYFEPWLGKGLLTSTGEKWWSHRKIIAPAFHLTILKSFVPLFYENSRDLVIKLREVVGKEFDCHDYLSSVTVDILLATAMGVKGTRKEKTSFEYAMAVMKMCNIVHQRQYNVMLRFDNLFKFTNFAKQQQKYLNTIHGLTRNVIRQKKAKYNKDVLEFTEKHQSKEKSVNNVNSRNTKKVDEKQMSMNYVKDDLDEQENSVIGEKKRLAFLDLMLDVARSGVKLTDEEIKEEVDTIMFEGHDTTAAGSSFVLCLLGIHQDIQARVYDELNEIFKGSDRQCTFNDTLEMKYLERVILESLRLFPPVPLIARQLKEDVKLVTNNYVLPKDCRVLIPMYKVHRQDKYYPNSDVFNPDNFLPERMQRRHYYAFIPFSAGPRSCVGRKYALLKLKVLLSTILRNYKILSDLTEKDFRLQIDVILKRSDGFKIKIEPRVKCNQENHVQIEKEIPA